LVGEEVMKNKTVDKVVNEARTKAIEKAYIPRAIRDSYKISIKNGKAILSKKSK